MKFYFRITLVFTILLLIASCSTYKPPKPAPLVKFKSSIVVKEQWSHTVGDGTGGEYLRLTPVLAGDNLFVNTYSGEVVAFNTKTGSKIWDINTRLNLTSGMAATNGMLFVGTDEAQLVAIRDSNGTPGWWAPMSNEVLATPCASGKVVLAKDDSGDIRAFNMKGKELWSYVHQNPDFILRGGSSPRIFGNRVIAGFDDGALVALNLKDGQEVWVRQIAKPKGYSSVQRMVDIDVNPHIVDGIIYVATYQGNIAAVRLKDGTILWKHKLSSYSGLAVGNGYVYVSDDSGNVWAFNAKTGIVLWNQNALLNRDITGPAIIGKDIVVGDLQGYLHFMSQKDGRFVARVRVGDERIIAAPLVNGNAVYVYSSDGALAKFIVGL